MRCHIKRLIAAAGFAILATLSAGDGNAGEFDAILSRINLPPGFKISIYAEVPRARSIVVGKPLGTVYVGSRHGSVHSLRDTNRDGIADEVLERASDLNVPNGLAMQDSILYIALNEKVVKWPVPAEFDSALPLRPLLDVYTGLPAEFLHGWRYAKFGPDRKLYVSVGAPCNICTTEGLTGTIIRMNPDGSGMEIVAHGVRNSVGFDWHPKTGKLFFTDNGADDMGDDIPADELNVVSNIGEHFGFPWFGGKSAKLTGFETATPPGPVTAPVIEFQAHSANLGIQFYDGDMFPAEYKHDAFVAQHGSWNRTEPVGYQIVRVRFDDDGNAVGQEVFASGWLEGFDAVGRPVDIAELPDGSLLVSDDFAGVIYRISYEG